MVVDAQRLPVERLADAAAEVAETSDLRVALDAVAAAVADATHADLAVLRVLDDEGRLATRAVAPTGSSLGAEVAGTRGLCEAVVAGEPTEPTRRAAAKARAAGTIALAARAGGHVVGSVELIRVGEEFGDDDRALAGLAAGQLALAVRTLAPQAGSRLRSDRLELAGEALAAGGDARRAAQQTVRIAVETTGARGGALWRLGEERPELIASLGTVDAGLARAAAIVGEAVAERRPAGIAHDPGTAQIATLTLGQPPFAALQLFYAEEVAPPEADLPALAAFAARSAHALRSTERVHGLEQELELTRSLLEVVAEESPSSHSRTPWRPRSSGSRSSSRSSTSACSCRTTVACAPLQAVVTPPRTKTSRLDSSRRCADLCGHAGRCTRAPTVASRRSRPFAPRSDQPVGNRCSPCR